ncbi:MAG: hypothetical protein IJP70_04210 [Bacteroidales bacterium]|nr:hypothetical protein [Bacteroidales bacterium]
MKKIILFASIFACLFTACEDDDNDVKIQNGDFQPKSEAVILYEGSYGQNNSDLSEFHKGVISADVYYQANGKYLGDTGNDILEVGDSYYIAVNGSNSVVKIDDDTYKEQARQVVNQPRYLASDGKYLYVSTYESKVLKLSLADLSVVAEAKTGAYTEGLAIEGDYLLAANSGWGGGNTVSVINLKSFETVQEIEVPYNPTSLMATGKGTILVKTTAYTADYSSAVSTISSIDVKSQFAVSTVAEASHMTLSADGNYVYFANCMPNYTAYTYQTSFFKYDLGKKEVSKDPVFANDSISTMLSGISLYLFSVNPKNGEIFIGTSDYLTNSALYVTDKKGNSWVRYSDAGGVNASKALFD